MPNDNYLFFGAITLETVDADDDVRSKDPFPLDTWDSTRAYFAVRADEGRNHHWSFHLPCIAAYDYTKPLGGEDNCGRIETLQGNPVWFTLPGASATCEAELLQGFFEDAKPRFVDAGLAQWVTPPDLVP